MHNKDEEKLLQKRTFELLDIIYTPLKKEKKSCTYVLIKWI